MSEESEYIKWHLMELAAYEDDDIESNEFDIYGEDDLGQEGCASIKINELAGKAEKEITRLQSENKALKGTLRYVIPFIADDVEDLVTEKIDEVLKQ